MAGETPRPIESIDQLRFPGLTEEEWDSFQEGLEELRHPADTPVITFAKRPDGEVTMHCKQTRRQATFERRRPGRPMARSYSCIDEDMQHSNGSAVVGDDVFDLMTWLVGDEN